MPTEPPTFLRRLLTPPAGGGVSDTPAWLVLLGLACLAVTVYWFRTGELSLLRGAIRLRAGVEPLWFYAADGACLAASLVLLWAAGRAMRR